MKRSDNWTLTSVKTSILWIEEPFKSWISTTSILTVWGPKLLRSSSETNSESGRRKKLSWSKLRRKRDWCRLRRKPSRKERQSGQGNRSTNGSWNSLRRSRDKRKDGRSRRGLSSFISNSSSRNTSIKSRSTNRRRRCSSRNSSRRRFRGIMSWRRSKRSMNPWI